MEILNFNIPCILDILLEEKPSEVTNKQIRSYFFLLYIYFSAQLCNVFSLISTCLVRLQMCLKGSWHVCKLDKVGGSTDWQRELPEVLDYSARPASIKRVCYLLSKMVHYWRSQVGQILLLTFQTVLWTGAFFNWCITTGLWSTILDENPCLGILWFSEEYPEITFQQKTLKWDRLLIIL